MGPLTIIAGTTDAVVAFREGSSKSGSDIADMAATSNGIDSGGAPAITALMARRSTVH